jgi:hypothetical protein
MFAWIYGIFCGGYVAALCLWGLEFESVVGYFEVLLCFSTEISE